MKTIGLVGGTTWVSSADYYRHFNEMTNQKLGGNASAKAVLYSVNFDEIAPRTHRGDWDGIAGIICQAAQKTEQAGADCVLLGANTMHHIAERVQEAVGIPLLHIADAVAHAITARGLKKVALLGTRYTMLFDFYRDKLAAYGIDTIVPGKEGIDFVNTSIYEELGKGKFLPGTKKGFLTLTDQLAQQGAEGVILGCTEIPLLIKQEDTAVPVFDSTWLHARAAVAFACS